VGLGHFRNPNNGNWEPLEASDPTRIARAGDGMTGPLTVQPPTQPDDAASKAYVDAFLPVGMIAPWAGAYPGTPPTGWLFCDNTVIAAQYTALKAMVGTNTPDLRGLFLVGTGLNSDATTGANTNYAAGKGSKLGKETVKLTGAESGTSNHGHTASSVAETQDHKHYTDVGNTLSGTVTSWHTHSGTSASGGPTHTHDDSVDEGFTTGDSNDWVDTADDDTGGVYLRTNVVRAANTAIGHTHTLTTGNPDLNHQHWVDPASTLSDSRSASHTHGITVANSTEAIAVSAHENRPPYYAIAYIIKT
jgi:microcystin-dependent protein